MHEQGMPQPLRRLLLLDAAICTATGLLLGLGSAPLARLTALPPGLLLWAGLALLPIAAFMALVARGGRRAGALFAAGGNLLWAAASLALAFGPWLAPNGLGTAFLVAQACAVALLAGLELLALPGRRPRAHRGTAA